MDFGVSKSSTAMHPTYTLSYLNEKLHTNINYYYYCYTLALHQSPVSLHIGGIDVSSVTIDFNFGISIELVAKYAEVIATKVGNDAIIFVVRKKTIYFTNVSHVFV